jgi:MOB kinase activator 1
VVHPLAVFWFSNPRSKATFRPLKKYPKDRRCPVLQEEQTATLGLGNMREAVLLPHGEDQDEWLAVNVVDFYNQLSMIYATITEFCTPETCPTMSAGGGFTYAWQDNQRFRQPTELPAPVYIGCLMDWVNEQLGDESVFPSTIGVPFPKNFESVIKTIMKRLFRVYAHCYHHHLQQLERLDILRHMNTSFKHFFLFTKEFNLISPEQLEPLKRIINQMEQH